MTRKQTPKRTIDKILSAINRLETWQVACILAVVGLCVFCSGLGNPFQNDDQFQIVNNPPVHSLANLSAFFQGGTYWDGQKLTGNYYRPLMTTAFSLLYSLFGAQPIAFHLLQLALYIACAVLLYLILRRFLSTAIALPLALIFLVHPLNSQVVYSIATLQDVLLFCSGMLALWILMRYRSPRCMWATAGCLLLALLSKEAGIIFVVLAALYLIIFDRARLKMFGLSIVAPIGLYLLLKFHAVGFSTAQHAAPIDSIGLAGRLLTLPSLPVFYLTKFLFPAHLATTYYWVDRTFTSQGVLLPLLVDLAVLAAAIYIGVMVRRRLPRPTSYAYWFFAAWVAISLLPYLQLTPLDMTACDTWFYIPMAGLLGMIGIAVQLLKPKVNPAWAVVAVIAVVSILGVRSFVRAQDYHSEYAIARANLAVSDDQFTAMTSISQYMIDHGNYAEAASYAQRSIEVYPVVSNYNLLGVALQQQGDYAGATQAYTQALHYGDSAALYENLSLILIVHGQPSLTSQVLHKGLVLYPQDFKLWIYLAIFEGSQGSTAEAKTAIQQSVKYGPTPAPLYNSIMADQPFALPILGKTLLIR